MPKPETRGRKPGKVKGDRVAVLTRLPRPVWEWLQAEATSRQSAMSQIMADVMSLASGRPDLVRDLNREPAPDEGVPLAM
jgi:hypothetical protein